MATTTAATATTSLQSRAATTQIADSTHITTTTVLRPFVRDYPGESVPEG